MVLLPGELVENLQHLVPDDGVQAGGRLVQNQQLWLVAQGHGDGQLHLHAPGKVLEGLLPRQVEAAEVAVVGPLVPVLVGPRHHLPHLDGGEGFRVIRLVQNDAHVLLHGPELRGGHIHPQNPGGPAVGAEGVHQQADGGGFARAVLPHQAADGAAGHREAQIPDGKFSKGLADMVQFNGVHTFSSSNRTRSMSISSSTVTEQLFASPAAAVRWFSSSLSCCSRIRSRFFSATKQPFPATV